MRRPDNIRENRWQVAPPVPLHLQDELSHIHPILLQTLYNRGISEPPRIQAFLEGRYLENTDPFLLPEMDKAVARIQQAIAQDEMIVVYGDFDADGVTSTVLLTQALRGLGMGRRQVRPYIPDRIDEGYGLNKDALAKLKEIGAHLVVTVDCGIRSIREVAYAAELGLDMIITDHHSLGPELPPAVAVINPKHPDSSYPDTMLAGVGIAYKLAQALYQTMPERVQGNVEDFLDLVAVGTVADLAPLLHENRKLVMDGLKVLNRLQRPGLAALANAVGLKPGNITSESIGFGLGPRINAAGRLAHAYTAARLLAANNNHTARQLARELNDLNKQRQKLTAELGAKAETMVNPNDLILIAGAEDFVPGVVGLVASRLADKNYRPAIVLEMGSEESRGSCRSIPEFHITDALDASADLLVRHGGHAQAAGLTLRNENLPQFKSRMREIAEAKLAGQDLVPTIAVDAEISLDEVDWALHETLAQLEPTGYSNPTPLFLSRNVEVMSHRAVGQDGTHLQMRLSSRNGDYAHQLLPAIAFRQGAWADALPQIIDVVYSVNINEWNGRRSLQLMVQDIRPHEA
ncbi:MAG: single-stranded-DNA-specific exonuclease RecJ [Chloroflexi bacterium]|nr:single-stranded-DNA-specific exonuclease RecJ [Chloroflexota bacterium]